MSDKFKERILEVAKRIPEGETLTYKKVAEMAGKPNAFRAVANILAKNRNQEIPCHRIIRNDGSVGGYFGSEKLAWKKAALLLKEGAIGILPTDTIYGICGSALNKKTIEKIYKLRKRRPTKPMIILISSLADLKIFGIKLKPWQKKILLEIWPAKISVILNCPSSKFSYLHRGTKTIAFRLSPKKELLKILSISGPLVVPSANWEGHKPAKNISEAKKYFGNQVFYLRSERAKRKFIFFSERTSKHRVKTLYYDAGKLEGKPSTLIDITRKPIKILRSGSDYKKLQKR